MVVGAAGAARSPYRLESFRQASREREGLMPGQRRETFGKQEVQKHAETLPLLSSGLDRVKHLNDTCICLLWFALGVTNAFPGVANQLFLIQGLQASPKAQTMIGVIGGVAWNLKMLVAFTSDCQPIFGYRRKPYLLVGLALYVVSYVLLALLPPTVATATSCAFFGTFGQMICGVMCDTLIVESMRLEERERRGQLQTRCWILITLGGIIGTLSGGHVMRYQHLSPQAVFGINALLKVAILPLVYTLYEQPVQTDGAIKPIETVTQRGQTTWQALQRASIWKPTIFVFLLGAAPNSGRVMTNFIVEKLHFAATDLSYISVVASLSSAMGMHLYYTFFRGVSWHLFFATVICFSSLLSLTQLILVFGLNRNTGIPDLQFALGDEFIMDMTHSLLQMPILILLASLCPEGVEGSVYALVTSAQMAGGTVGGAVSAKLIGSLGITLHNFAGFARLIVICAAVRLLVLPLLPLLPSCPAEEELDAENAAQDLPLAARRPAHLAPKAPPAPQEERSQLGAAAVLAMLMGGISWALLEAFWTLTAAE